ncbi:MAG: S8 family serine peptidase [Candidatus Woesearchaeota archaeon]
MKKKILLFFIIILILITLSTNLIYSKNEKTNKPKISPEIDKYIDKIKKDKIEKNKNDLDIKIPVIISLKKNQKLNNEIITKSKHIKLNDKKFIIANITIDDFEKLKENPEIEAIYYNPRLKIFLDTSTKLLGSDSFWNLSINQESVNGSTQTACVIDTGIDFSHSAFGSCSINYFNNQGNNVSYFLETEHPYPINTKIKYKINYTGFSKIAVHFRNISVENEWDFIKILDENNYTIASYTGNLNNIWSPSVNGDTIYVLLESDESFNDYGFFIDEIKNGTTNNTVNWSCEKIIGGWDFINNDPIPYDDNGHGTHVSGIIASQNSNYPGVAKGSKLVSIKAMDSYGEGSPAIVAAGINYCVENKEKYNISVISMSLGDGSFSNYCDDYIDWFTDIVQIAIDKNISVVIASGNNGNSNGIAFPSCLKNVTSVGSVDKSRLISSYSQSSLILDLLAYGTNIISSQLSGGFISSSGTSMATPHVSGSILLINDFKKKQNTNSVYTPIQLETILKNTGILINDSRNNLSFPLVNLSNVLKEINTFPIIIFHYQDLNNSNISRNYSYLEFSFSTYVKNITLFYDSFNVSLNKPYTNVSYNLTNLTDGFHNYSIFAYDILENPVQSGTFFFYVDTIIPKSINDLNATLLEDGSVFLEWSKVIFDINNNTERVIYYNLYRTLNNQTNLLETIQNYNEIINYTDTNITTNNYTYYILTSDISGNINNSITEKNSITISVFCNTTFSNWSSFSNCINGIQTRQRQRICFGKQEIETETQNCIITSTSTSSGKSSGSRSSGGSSSTFTYLLNNNSLQINKKEFIIKNNTLNLTKELKNIQNYPLKKILFNQTNIKITLELINNLSKIEQNNELNNIYTIFNITLNTTAEAELFFSVNETWLLTKKINPENIALFKYIQNNQTWNLLETEFLDKEQIKNETYYNYKSYIPNFSLFAIAESQKNLTQKENEKYLNDSIISNQISNLINAQTNVIQNISEKQNKKNKTNTKLKIFENSENSLNSPIKAYLSNLINSFNINNQIYQKIKNVLFFNSLFSLFFIIIILFFIKNKQK